MGFLAPFLQDRGTTSNLQHRNPSPVSVVAVTEEHGGGSHEEAGPLSPPALSAAMADEAATAPAADSGPVGRSQWRVQPPEEGRGRKRRRPEMSSFEQGMLALMKPLATLASQPHPQPQPQPQPPSEDEIFFRSPPRCQDPEGTFHYQTSPDEAVVKHLLLQSVMLSREWPQQVGHGWDRLIPHKHVRKWPPLLCSGDDTGGREVKGAITKSFPKRRVTEGAAVTRPAVASNIHNPEQVVS